ncbi:hypothetical protein OIV83_006501 [Microbotryomycetes sp. JL201]|nr:hypothetical protein OIV83_006501 [Microbotryomycetes sp. JL201]
MDPWSRFQRTVSAPWAHDLSVDDDGDCSGSMKYVHESCLNDWINARGSTEKPKCELCGHPLTYEKVFADDMPSSLPPLLFVRHFFLSASNWVLYGLRALLVGTAWLVLLPHCIVWIFRFLLWAADSVGIVALFVSGRAPNHLSQPGKTRRVSNAISVVNRAILERPIEQLRDGLLSNVTAIAANWTDPERLHLLARTTEAISRAEANTMLPMATCPNTIGNLTALAITTYEDSTISSWQAFVNTFASDTFTGQIITSVVVIVFVIGFFVREWIVMNVPVEEPQPQANMPLRDGQIAVMPPTEIAALIEQLQPHEEASLHAEPREPSREEPQPVDVFMHALEERASERQQAQIDFEHNVEPNQGSPLDQDDRPRIRRAETGRSPSPFDLAAASTFGANVMDLVEPERDDANERLELLDRASREPSVAARPAISREVTPAYGSADETAQHFRPPMPTVPPAHSEPALRQLPHAPPPPQEGPAPPLVPAPVPRPEEQPRAAADDQDDDRDMLAEDFLDDLNGILEAVGMKGSLLTFVQNVGLMILLVSLCLTGGVWAPLCIGRVLSALNAVKLIAAPVRLVRMVSDPVFDALLSSTSKVLHSILASAHNVLANICHGAPLFFSTTCGQLMSTLAHATSDGVNVTLSANEVDVATARATLLKQVFHTIGDHWQRMPYANDTLHRGLCIALGYASLLFAGVWFVSSTQGEYGEQMHRAIREGIRQQLVLLKVCAVIIVEIIAFPAMCGALLDLATLPLFSGATIASRIAFHARTPLTAFFVVWFSGTGFMFIFASWIDHVRTFVRPGLIWFVRDPQSSDFHPVREILTKPAREQARKIATSALMYAGVVFASVGSCVYGVRLVLPGLLPLHLPLTRLHTVPFDLVFYRYVVPYSLRFFDPRATIQTLCESWAKKTAHHLRLTSFLFGERDASEEGSHVRRTWKAQLLLKRGDANGPDADSAGFDDNVSRADVVFRKDGGFGRVPAVDNIRVAPGRRMIVRVDEQGRPLDADGARIVVAQLIELSTTRKNDKYRIVYLPPNFAPRVCLFLYLMWFTGSLAACSTFVLPLVIGRWLFSLVLSQPTHDIYAFGLGLYTIGSAILLTRVRQQTSLSLGCLGKTASGIALGLLIGVVLPTLVSFVGLAFVYVPYTLSKGISLADETGTVPISVMHCWATGTVLTQILVKVILRFDVLPPEHILRRRIEAGARAWSENNIVETAAQLNTAASIISLGLLTALAAPVLAAIVWSQQFASTGATPLGVLQVTCTIVALVLTVAMTHDKIRTLTREWSRRKLEETYLVTKQLQNWNRAKSE